jgi:hypothetical protein
MTPQTAFHTLDIVMFTDAQNLYLSEVLGVNPNSLSKGGAITPPLLVLAHAATPSEAQLLEKILASVNLGQFECHASLTPPDDHRAAHVLVFGGGLSDGRHDLGHKIWWSAPALKDMVGSGPQVAAAKKSAWSILQILAKELA